MINKTAKTIIFFSILTILCFSASNASAYYSYYQSNLPSYQTSYPQDPIVIGAPIINNQTVITPVNNTSTSQSSSTPARTVSRTQTNNSSTSSNSSNTSGAVNADQTSGNDLTALSMNGSGGFMPSSVWQWLIVIFLILVIVILARVLGKKPQPENAHVAPAH